MQLSVNRAFGIQGTAAATGIGRRFFFYGKGEGMKKARLAASLNEWWSIGGSNP